MTAIIICLVCTVISLVLHINTAILISKKIWVRPSEKSDYYFDYVCGSRVIRIFAPEYEHIALQGVNERTQIMDRGRFGASHIYLLLDFNL